MSDINAHRAMLESRERSLVKSVQDSRANIRRISATLICGADCNLVDTESALPIELISRESRALLRELAALTGTESKLRGVEAELYG